VDATRIRLVVTDYWSADWKKKVHEGVLHSLTDRPLDSEGLLSRALLRIGAEDGDEIEILITVTGRRPFEDRRVRILSPFAPEREGLGSRLEEK